MSNELVQRDTQHRLFTPTISRIVARAVFKAQSDDKLGRRAGSMIALRDVAEGMADVLHACDSRFDRIAFLRQCGVR